ncbi:hypothetical protein ACWF94_33595 [Streptomyces sp. NPDC055078]
MSERTPHDDRPDGVRPPLGQLLFMTGPRAVPDRMDGEGGDERDKSWDPGFGVRGRGMRAGR